MSAVQEVRKDFRWVSELLFGCLFGSFALWIASPFVLEKKRFYSIVLVARLLAVLVGALLSCVLSTSRLVCESTCATKRLLSNLLAFRRLNVLGSPCRGNVSPAGP